jgi:hypothetical protein
MNDPSVLQFLEERVRQEPLFKQQLIEYIEYSKKDAKWSTAAANSITILVRACVQLNSVDLRGIRVELSYRMFDPAQLQGADLRHVDLHGAWLRGANMSQSQMTGLRVGELPYLKQDRAVSMCVYSPDGSTMAASVFDIKLGETMDIGGSQGQGFCRQPQSQHHGHHHHHQQPQHHYGHHKYHLYDPTFSPLNDKKVSQAGYEYRV